MCVCVCLKAPRAISKLVDALVKLDPRCGSRAYVAGCKRVQSRILRLNVETWKRRETKRKYSYKHPKFHFSTYILEDTMSRKNARFVNRLQNCTVQQSEKDPNALSDDCLPTCFYFSNFTLKNAKSLVKSDTIDSGKTTLRSSGPITGNSDNSNVTHISPAGKIGVDCENWRTNCVEHFSLAYVRGCVFVCVCVFFARRSQIVAPSEIFSKFFERMAPIGFSQRAAMATLCNPAR